jgi:toxin ParE1/3/4
MANFKLRPKAVSDLEEIWHYTIKTWDEEQAECYLRLLNMGFIDLSIHPHLGRSCDKVRSGYRAFRVGSHMIFYRVTGEGIEIARILHQSMDFNRHLP